MSEPTGAPPETSEPTGAPPETSEPTGAPPETSSRLPLRRSGRDRMVAGVCAGLGRYLGIDPVVVRIGTVVLALVVGIEVLLAYLIAALLIPSEDRNGEASESAWDMGERSRLVLGVVLVLLGLSMFFLEIVPWIRGLLNRDTIGALLLIGAGVLVLTVGRR